MTAHQREVLRSVLTADLSPIFTEGDVQDVVEFVLDLPVVANVGREFFGLRQVAGDVERARDRELLAGANAYDLDDAFQVGPRRFDAFWQLTNGHGSHDTALEPPMRFIILDSEQSLAARSGVEALTNVVVQLALVAFEGKDVVGAAVPNRPGDLSVATSCIRSHGSALNVQTAQEFDRSGGLVSGGLDGRLREKQALLGCPNVKQVKRPASASRMGQRATERLAVDRDGLPLKVAQKRLQPTPESELKCLRIERLEDASKGVGAGRAVRHVEKLGEELLLHLGVVLEGFPAIGASQRTEEGHRQDVDERMRACPRDTRVIDFREDVEKGLQNRRGLGSRHRRSGSCPKRRVSIIR